MPIGAGEVRGVQSASHPGDSTTPAGGEISDPRVPVLFVLSSWFTRLPGNPTGDLNTDAILEYQKIFIENSSVTSTALSVKIWVHNGLKPLTVNGTIKVGGTEPTSTKFKVFGDSGVNSILTDNIISGGDGSHVSGSIGFNDRIFRVVAQATSDSSVTTVANDVPIYDHGDNLIGIIPQGCSYATNALRIGMPDTTDDTQDTPDRFTSPTGITVDLVNDPSEGLYIRNDVGNADLAPGEAQGVWGEYIDQPGMEPADEELILGIEFESGP